jgi:hypothetical protein
MFPCPELKEATMQRAFGWAAFLASVTLFSVFGPQSAGAAGNRPTYACFSSQNAAVMGRLGADDASVRYGFESGACLALERGAPIQDAERLGGLWRFRAFGARPHLYAPDWAAGFDSSVETAPQGFEQYLPVTARLLAAGRSLVECNDNWAKLVARIDDHERRWKKYRNGSRTKYNGSTPVVVIYVGDSGPKLAAEGEQLRRHSAALERRCASIAAMEIDDGFLAFLRTARI